MSVGSSSVHLLVARASEPPAGPHVPPDASRSRLDAARSDAAADPSASVPDGRRPLPPPIAVVPGARLHLAPLADESEIVGLGSLVDAGGDVPRDAEDALLALLRRYLETARGIGVDGVLVIATEPLRRASNAARVAERIRALPGVAVHVLDHAEEAELALLAARAVDGRRAEEGPPAGVRRPGTSATRATPAAARPSTRTAATGSAVLDIGGGSTEWAIVRPRRPVRIGTLAIGAARLADLVPTADPPGPAGMVALLDAARDRVRGLPRMKPVRAIVLGGTGSNLGRLINEVTEPAVEAGRGPSVEGSGPAVLDRRAIEAFLAVLAREPSGHIAGDHGIRPERARILPAGAAVLAACLERWSWPVVLVSEASIREGALVAVAAAGDAWRSALPGLVAALDA